jgi:hypothetical protein
VGLQDEALCAVTVGAVEDSALMVISNPGDILAIEKGLEKLREVKSKELFKFGQLSSAGAANLRGMLGWQSRPGASLLMRVPLSSPRVSRRPSVRMTLTSVHA